MGAFWFVFEPLANILVMFGERVFLRGVELKGFDYPVFLFSGVVPYLLFKNIALQAMSAVDANRNLFAYRQIKPLDCIVARVIVECVLMGIVWLCLLFVLGFWVGYDVSLVNPLGWLVTIFFGVVFSFALGIIYCVIVEAFPSVKTFIGLSYIPLYFLSSVLIPAWFLPYEVQGWLAWNPYFQLIEELRANFFPGYPVPVGVGMGPIIFASIVTLCVALGLYQARRQNLVSL
ncbi:capsular polysaccharide transport system permease protein [Paraburkholderia caballeronis]|nr:capsular polysaccharide transport system permease protein [Paraburkholderia caballeronis]